MSRTAVVLVNWNGWRDTLECLASLLRLQRAPAHIIVVDNASPDGSSDQLERWCRGELDATVQNHSEELPRLALRAPADLSWACIDGGLPMPPEAPRVLIVRSASNRGFAGGNNLGIALARQSNVDWVWLLNTDTVVAPDALEALLERARARPDAGMVGSSLIYYWNPSKVQALGGASFDPVTGASACLGNGCDTAAIPSDPAMIEAQTAYVVGASMLVTSAFLDAIGPMCEDYFLYFEEIDWAVRARGRFGMAYAPRSRVFHKVGGSSVKQASRLALRYLYRNRLVFIARFFPQSLPGAKRHLRLQFLQHLWRGHWNDLREIAGALRAAPQLIRQGGQR